MAFLTGALAFWMPTFLSRAQVTQKIRPPCFKEPCDPTDRCSMTFDLRHHLPNFFQNLYSCNDAICLCSLCSYIFGAVTVVTGILGASLGTLLSRWFRNRVSNADPLICAVGMLGSAPCLFITIFVALESIPATYVRDKSFLLNIYLNVKYCPAGLVQTSRVKYVKTM